MLLLLLLLLLPLWRCCRSCLPPQLLLPLIPLPPCNIPLPLLLQSHLPKCLCGAAATPISKATAFMPGRLSCSSAAAAAKHLPSCDTPLPLLMLLLQSQLPNCRYFRQAPQTRPTPHPHPLLIGSLTTSVPTAAVAAGAASSPSPGPPLAPTAAVGGQGTRAAKALVSPLLLLLLLSPSAVHQL